ncbi:MAG: carboxypeptidase-like regulatory domain-containing protein [Bryobacteraceae bacterium]
MAHKVLVFFTVAFMPVLLNAQSYTASIRGVVTDASQAPLPAAKVTVTDADRNTSQTATSDNAGRYVVTSLPPGHYTLAVEASGFKKYERSVFELQVQQQATIDVQLGLGMVATSIDVNATAPLLNTTSSTLGQVIDNKFIL